MNIFEERLPKLKQELWPILFLSIVQIWWNFNFPGFMRLQSPWNIIIAFCSSIASTALIIYAFSCVNKHTRRFNAESLEKQSYDFIFKNLDTICLALVAHIAIFLIWYNDVYGMSNQQYLLFYVHGFIMFVLLHRATKREPLK